MQVQIRHHVFWRSNRCNQTTIGNANVQGALLRCQSGCVGGIDQRMANCTDISVADHWNAGEMVYTYIFRTFRTHPFFEAV